MQPSAPSESRSALVRAALPNSCAERKILASFAGSFLPEMLGSGICVLRLRARAVWKKPSWPFGKSGSSFEVHSRLPDLRSSFRPRLAQRHSLLDPGVPFTSLVAGHSPDDA